tara:strand:+ start:466 stop:987 length:522 start_codon:yes stop_codon:yes gene_type:complete
MAGIIKVNQYQDFNGNTLFTSDGSGNLTTQEINYPAFAAYLNSNTAIAQSTWVKLVCDVEDYDTNNSYDTSNGRFTVASGKQGKYLFTQTVTMQAAFAYAQLSLYINGNSRFRGGSVGNTAASTVTGQYSINLSAGDYVEFYVNQNQGSQNLSGFSDHSDRRDCFVSGVKIGS